MGKFDRNDRRGSRFGSSRGDRGDRGERTTSMHSATCAECGQKCEVPFKPTGDRPVYCSNCFDRQSGRDSSSRSNRKSFDRPSFGDRPKFEAVCDKCGKRCEVPFRPTGGKPIYCNDCFDKGGSAKPRQTDAGGDQLAMINSKLDRILRLLAPAAASMASTEKASVETKVAKTEAIKPAKENSSAKKEKKSVSKIKTADKKSAVKKKKK